MLQRRRLDMRRLQFLRAWERRHKHRLIALIHRQETMSLFGFPLVRYIDIQDSEEVLRALRLTADDVPIDIVLHTPGGLALAAEQIAHAICRRTAKVTVYVPHYAMSGGTLIALAADEIVMDPNAVLGSLDPQLGQHPAASIVKAVDWKIEHKQEIDDETLILADVARKAMVQLRDCVRGVLMDRLGPEKAESLASIFTRGEWTHDHPLDVETLGRLGLPINTEMPAEIEEYMRLFPQAPTGRPSVQYVPLPYRSPPPAPAAPVPRAGRR
ncbi:MAG TPA: S49 family peptidase [Candidatus Binatia bacterium]|nr:S49 family peptidase [Candidatus Binatia bacterium]